MSRKATVILALAATLVAASTLPARAEMSSDAAAWFGKLGEIMQSSPTKATMHGAIDMAALFEAFRETGAELPPDAEAMQSMKMAYDAEMFTNGPRHMNMSTRMSMSGLPAGVGAPEGGQMDMTMLQVFDGEMMWMEMTNPMMGGSIIMKMSLDQAEKLSGDMAEKLGLGGGLSFGDPVSQFRMMGELMHCTVESIENGEVVLAGKLDWDAIRNLMNAVPSDGLDRAQLDAMLEKLGTYRFVLDEATALPKRVIVGDKAHFMEMDFSEYRVIDAADIPEGTFSYTPPEGAQVMDLGALMGAMMQQEQEAEPTPEPQPEPQPAP